MEFILGLLIGAILFGFGVLIGASSVLAGKKKAIVELTNDI